MTDPRNPEAPNTDDVTEESGAGYGNNAETGGTEAPGDDEEAR